MDGVANVDVGVDVGVDMAIGSDFIVVVTREGVRSESPIAVWAVDADVIWEAWSIVTGAGVGSNDFATVGGARGAD